MDQDGRTLCLSGQRGKRQSKTNISLFSTVGDLMRFWFILLLAPFEPCCNISVDYPRLTAVYVKNILITCRPIGLQIDHFIG